ncbi:MAG: sigma 54-interacting transcriptional regulator [Ignavibacterium sp.]|nr:sigma 54-interacting transcriptional regulator [Ignavibacterium sp.]
MDKKFLIKIFVALAVIVLLFLFVSVSRSFDASLSTLISRTTGETQPDTNIVIIHISSEDIEQIGPWPLKRSYYALLINQLTGYDVKKIGLEVFLSSKFITQVIYDNVLQKEISNSGRVVLSSLAGQITAQNNFYITDSLSLPSPKLIDESLLTGHLNYFDSYGIEIPLELINRDLKEKAFSLNLAGIEENYPSKIRINFLASWKKYKTYSLLEFFDLIRIDDNELNILKDKIILIGISDPQISSTFQTNYDPDLPGVALHAFALDNLLNSRYYDDKYYILSAFLFSIILLLLIFLLQNQTRKFRLYFLALSIIITAAFIFNRYLYLELAYSFFIIPLFFVIVSEFAFRIIKSRHELRSAVDEAELLKKLLGGKENELLNLQQEFEASEKEKSELLLAKIKTLKSDISKLKENEEDKQSAEFKDIESDKKFYGLVYRSVIMSSVVELIKKASPTGATILITGESGTGKELVARSIHNLSSRKENSFIAVNCAALPETLLESELFGHVKGSFTGAIADKIGKFEAANKGTIFLDEIGETSENFQVKLLRVLQSGEIDKIGSVTSKIVDVRVIAATNKDLKQIVIEKKFREDLFYRINVLNIHLPPLRDRKEDIEPIAAYLLKQDGDNINFSVAVLRALNEYNWKGNVRELESVIKRAVIFCKSSGRNLIQLNDLPDDLIKNIKLNFEDLVIESLRLKGFSHSSINETAKELGKVNRTIISENFRGYSLKILVEQNFDEELTAAFIADSDDFEVVNRVKVKLDTWLNNIKKDIQEYKSEDFSAVRDKLSSKYKNLPQKFHIYLDEVIKHFLQKK